MSDNLQEFSKLYTHRIENFISGYYKRKAGLNSSGILKKIYFDIEEYCLRPGKRIRPLLLLAAYAGYSQKQSENEMNEIIRLSSVLEIMHSFLLIHDDVIDKAVQRRGKESMHVIHNNRYRSITKSNTVGNDIAVITGDMMSFDCIEIIADTQIDAELKSDFLKTFSETYIYTTWGQILDIVNSLPIDLKKDSTLPYDISLYKTTYYTISNPLIMGYILSGGKDETEKESIRDFSLPLGLSFQFRDDLLGVFGKPDATGKSASSDIEEGKYTLLIDYALKNLTESERHEFETVFLKEAKSEDDICYIREVIEKTGARTSAEKRVMDLSRESLLKLENLNINDNIKSVLKDVIKQFSELK
ncbi:MAG: polyprenyl synthetase family protein [Spirochaetes bacterium]|nr:polyprenyl synthetase family protein [Spirochaetota bacterium]